MAIQNLDFGTASPNDGEFLPTAFLKTQENFAALYASDGTVTHVVTDVASAATCDIGAAATDRVRITGSVTITSLGTSASKLRFVHFAAAPLLTHNATSLILPGAENIQPAAGDCALFSSDASGNWRCLAWQDAAGLPVTGPSTATDNALARFNADTGRLVKNSGVIVDNTNNVSGVVNLTQTGYQDLTEIAAPANPAANVMRLYAVDDATITKLGAKDAAGTTHDLTHFTQAGSGATLRTQQSKLRDAIHVHDFGAVGDGVTDDRAAIQAAISALAMGGTLLFGPKQYAVGKHPTGAYCLAASSPLQMIGHQGGSILPLASATSTVDVLYLTGSSFGAFAQTILDGLFIGNNGAATRNGRHAVVFDTTTAGNIFARPIIRNCYLQQSATTGSYGVSHVNTTANNANGGLYAAIIEGNAISGISLSKSGDSIWIKNNLLTGNQPGVYADLTSGAGNLVVAENNITANAGSVVIDAAVTAEIVNNEMEQQATNTQANNSMIDLRGATATLGPVRITGNLIQDDAATGLPTLIRVGAASGVVIDNNRLATSTARTAVNITASAANTVWGGGNTLVTGTLLNSSTSSFLGRINLLSGCTTQSGGAGATDFFMNVTNATESNVAFVTTAACVFDKLYMYTAGAPGAGQTYTITFRTALTTDTALTCTISGDASNSASDLTNSVSVAAGVRINLKIVSSATAANTGPITWGLRMSVP